MNVEGLFGRGSLLLLICASFAAADTVVVPNTLATVEGNDNNFGPFFNNSVRYQQVYSASQFPSGPIKITGIAFRPDGSVTDPNLTIIFSTVQMDLSTTAGTPGTLSATFADNVGPDNKTVFNSFVFMNAPVTGPAGGPKDFTVAFSLTPFIYNPGAGNLLLDVRAFESGEAYPHPFIRRQTARSPHHLRYFHCSHNRKPLQYLCLAQHLLQLSQSGPLQHGGDHRRVSAHVLFTRRRGTASSRTMGPRPGTPPSGDG